MDASAAGSREIAVPGSVFTILRRELEKEAGPLPTIHALHAAGYDAGEAAAEHFRGTDPEAGRLPQDVFWTRIDAYFSRRGWGSLRHSAPHDGVGVLASEDWAESGGDRSPQASCSFTTGFLSGLLTSLAGGPIAVLEVSCLTRGDESCAFAFGSEQAIHELYGHLKNEGTLQGALAHL